MNTRSRIAIATSCACCLGMAWWAQAQQSGEKDATNDAPLSIFTPILPENPTTSSNAAERVRAALKAARDAEAGRGYPYFPSDPVVDRLREVPGTTLPLLVPYATHPSDKVRAIVADVARDAMSGQSMLSQPIDENTRTLAMRVLARIAGIMPSASALSASQTLYNTIITGLLPGFSEPPDLLGRYAKAGVKRGLMRQLSYSGEPDGRSVLMLSLYKDDPVVGDFLARVAKRENYPLVVSLARTQWNDGNALEAVEHELKVGSAEFIASIADKIRFIDHPQVLRFLALHLDDKRETVFVKDDHINPPEKARVCDHVLAALKVKLEGFKADISRPDIATDDEIARAKARFAPLIDALPIPNAPPL